MIVRNFVFKMLLELIQCSASAVCGVHATILARTVNYLCFQSFSIISRWFAKTQIAVMVHIQVVRNVFDCRNKLDSDKFGAIAICIPAISASGLKLIEASAEFLSAFRCL